MDHETGNGKRSANTTQELRRSLIRMELSTLLDLIKQEKDQKRINGYAEALDDLTPGQIEHGFRIVRRNAGEFWPNVHDIREACETWRPLSEPESSEPLTEAEVSDAAIRFGRATPDEIQRWKEEGKRAQQEHIANLKADPDWQRMVENLNRKR